MVLFFTYLILQNTKEYCLICRIISYIIRLGGSSMDKEPKLGKALMGLLFGGPIGMAIGSVLDRKEPFTIEEIEEANKKSIEAIRKSYEAREALRAELKAKKLEDINKTNDNVDEESTLVNDMRLLEKSPDNDYGNAELLVTLFGDEIKYIPTDDIWRVYDGKRWRQDTKKNHAINQVCKFLYQRMSALLPNIQKGNPLIKRINNLGKQRIINAMIEQAKLQAEFPANKFDTHNDLLVAQNGIVNLRTGKLQPFDAEKYITTMVNMDYNEDIEPPKRFLQFLNEIFDGDQDLIEYMHRILGYCITGETREQVFFIFGGSGSNGKSVLANVINLFLNDLSATLSEDALAQKMVEGAPNPSMVQAKDARVVFVNENKKRTEFNLSLIKKVSGEDPIKIRTLYSETIEFKAHFKLIFITNPKLDMGWDEHAMRRRVRAIPFNVTFASEDEMDSLRRAGKVLPKDSYLQEKLLVEKESIFRWLVEGAMKWYNEGGLGETPIVVKNYFDDYRKETDSFFNFESTMLSFTGNSDDIIQSDALYRKYIDWCDFNDIAENIILTLTAFGRRMAEIKKVEKFKGTGGCYYYRGVKEKS